MSKSGWVTKACGIFLLWAMAAVALPAQTLATLFSFDYTDGFEPAAPLVQGTDGNFYGTASFGGTSNACGYGCGTVFKISPGGTLTTIYNFCSLSNCTDGYKPLAGLVQGADGNFYGTTALGGTNTECLDSTGCGTVFTITPTGTLTTLRSFNFTDGYFPEAGLIQGTDGNFYGTTFSGGSGCGDDYQCGTVFKITPGGVLRTLYNFCSLSNCADGFEPGAGLVQGINGKFFGTTEYGGAYGAGTIFTITPEGRLTTLYSFCSLGGFCPDGYTPMGGLVQGTDGDFYGTTEFGGGGNNAGTIFKITPSGMLTSLYSFCVEGDCPDGANPLAPLVQGTDGGFYGTTYWSGTDTYCTDDFDVGCGTVFKITSAGKLATLRSFAYTNGAGPEPLIQGTDGSFYGATASGGAYNNCRPTDSGCGTIFSLSVGLKPFVETQPTSGTVGTAVNILGSNLTGATSVTFNGTAAAFTVASKTLITTMVPAGATTGTVEVVRPNGKGSSNVPFTVLP